MISPTAIPTLSTATTRVIYVLTTGGTMAAHLVRAGVDVAFHGAIYPVHRVRKDHAQGGLSGRRLSNSGLGVFGVWFGPKLELFMRKS